MVGNTVLTCYSRSNPLQICQGLWLDNMDVIPDCDIFQLKALSKWKFGLRPCLGSYPAIKGMLPFHKQRMKMCCCYDPVFHPMHRPTLLLFIRSCFHPMHRPTLPLRALWRKLPSSGVSRIVFLYSLLVCFLQLNAKLGKSAMISMIIKAVQMCLISETSEGQLCLCCW